MSVTLIQFDGLSSGYAPVPGRNGWFTLLSLALDLPRVSIGGRSGGRGDGATLIGFTIMRMQDAASARLLRWVADGTVLRKVVVEVFDNDRWVVRYTFGDVIGVSFSIAATGEAGPPSETVGFTASSVSVETPT